MAQITPQGCVKISFTLKAFDSTSCKVNDDVCLIQSNKLEGLATLKDGQRRR